MNQLLVYKFIYMSFLVNLLPGADRLFVISIGLSKSKRAGIIASLGISTGILLHSLVGAFGLAALLILFPSVFDLIRGSGILLLFVLGIQFFMPPSSAAITKYQDSSNSFFWKGLFIHLLNPIALVFSFTFIPQFINLQYDFAIQFLLLAAISNIISFILNLMVVYFLFSFRKQFQISERSVRLFSGLILVGIALKISFDWIVN